MRLTRGTQQIEKKEDDHKIMDNLNLSDPQNPDAPVKPRRPNRNFPLYIVTMPDGTKQFMMADKLAEYQAKLAAEEAARQSEENAKRDAIEAERAAGRPPEPAETSFGLAPPVEDVVNDPEGAVTALTEQATNHSNGLQTGRRVAQAQPLLKSFPSHASFDSLASASSVPPDFSRHSRRCLVCPHPDRDAIEGEFIRWRSPAKIAEDYDIADRASIYRHAHATGLFRRRRSETARVLENALEQAEDCPLHDFDIITRAVRLYSRFDDEGRFHEPPRINYVFTGPAWPPEPAAPDGTCEIPGGAEPDVRS